MTQLLDRAIPQRAPPVDDTTRQTLYLPNLYDASAPSGLATDPRDKPGGCP